MDAVSVKRAQLFLLRKKSLCLRLPRELEGPKTEAENRSRKQKKKNSKPEGKSVRKNAGVFRR